MMREFFQQAAKEVFTDKDIWHKYVRSGEMEFNFIGDLISFDG